MWLPPLGGRRRPKPRKSGAMKRQPSGMRSCWGRHMSADRGNAWRRTTGQPAPASSHVMLPRAVSMDRSLMIMRMESTVCDGTGAWHDSVPVVLFLAVTAVDVSGTIALGAIGLLTLNLLLGLLLSVGYNPARQWPRQRMKLFTLHNW